MHSQYDVKCVRFCLLMTPLKFVAVFYANLHMIPFVDSKSFSAVFWSNINNISVFS